MADRLRREADPPSGMPASPVPQYWRDDIQEYEKVQGAHGATRTILYGPDGQPISSSNRLPVEATLTGRQVDVLTVFDAEEIRDTNLRQKTVDVSSYRLIKAVAITTLNAPVSIVFRSPSGSNIIRVWDGDGWVQLPEASIDAPVNPHSFLLNTFWPELNQLGWTTINFRVTPSAAPSVGSFTLQIWGVPL